MLMLDGEETPEVANHDFCERFGIARGKQPGTRRPVRQPTKRQQLNRIRQILDWQAQGATGEMIASRMILHWGMKSEERRDYFHAARVFLMKPLKKTKAALFAEQVNKYEYLFRTSLDPDFKLAALDRLTKLFKLDEVKLEALADAEAGKTDFDALRNVVSELSIGEIEAEEKRARKLIEASNGESGGASNGRRSA